MTALLTQLTSTTVNINFGSLTDLFSDAKWEEFSRKVFEDVTKSFEYMNTDKYALLNIIIPSRNIM